MPHSYHNLLYRMLHSRNKSRPWIDAKVDARLPYPRPRHRPIADLFFTAHGETNSRRVHSGLCSWPLSETGDHRVMRPETCESVKNLFGNIVIDTAICQHNYADSVLF